MKIICAFLLGIFLLVLVVRFLASKIRKDHSLKRKIALAEGVLGRELEKYDEIAGDIHYAMRELFRSEGICFQNLEDKLDELIVKRMKCYESPSILNNTAKLKFTREGIQKARMDIIELKSLKENFSMSRNALVQIDFVYASICQDICLISELLHHFRFLEIEAEQDFQLFRNKFREITPNKRVPIETELALRELRSELVGIKFLVFDECMRLSVTKKLPRELLKKF